MAVTRNGLSTVLAVICFAGFGRAQESAVEPRLPPLLERHGHRAVVLPDGLVVALGGFGRGSDAGKRRTLLWRPGTSAWQRGADMAVGRAFFGSAVVGGRLYAIGTGIERYDAAANAWTTVLDGARLPRSHLSAATFRGKIHVLGGFPSSVSRHHVFDPVTGALTKAPAPPGFAPGAHLHLLAAIGDLLHCVGGVGGTGFALHAAFDGQRWRARAAPPIKLWAKFSAFAVAGDSLYVFADGRGLRYDAKADRWSDVAPLRLRLAMPVAVVRGGSIEVFGGRLVGGGGYGRARYDLATDQWIVGSTR